MIWIIDNGHGGIKNGVYVTKSKHKKSPVFDDGYVLYEGQWNRDVSNKILEKSITNDLNVINLVPEIDDISLNERVDRVNKLVKNNSDNMFLISIHMNGTDEFFTTEKSGLTTFYYRKNEGRKYAYIFQDYIGDVIGNRGIFEKGFKMLNKVTIPAILLECGFMNNKNDVKFLKTETGKDKLSDAIIKSMKKIENKIKEYENSRYN